MRRSRKGAGVIVALVLLVPLLVPALAGAADAQFAGTYKGYGKGVDTKGKSAYSGLTFWVEDLGDELRVTVRVARLGVTFSTTGADEGSGETVSIPIEISMPGVDGSGTITIEPDGEDWILSARGSGTLVGYEGSGEAIAVRTATGVVTPSMTDQFDDLVSAVFGGPPAFDEDPGVKEGEGKLQAPDPPAEVEQIAEASSLSPAEASPPIPEDDKWAAGIAMAAICMVMFGFFVFI